MASPASVLNLMVVANTAPANAALLGTQARLRATANTARLSGRTMAKAFAGVGLAAGAAGVALFKVGEEFDASYDKIRTQTGATGKEMVKLKRSFRDVVSDVPTDFENAGKAVGELNTRLGLSGRSLNKMSKQMLELSRLTDTDVSTNIENVSRAFVDWEVAVKDQTKTLDGFFRLSQKSGMAVADIALNVQKFGSPLRQLGFTLDEAAAMFASFERAGVNIQTMVPGLKLAISNLTRPTETLAVSMKKLGIEAGNPEKALKEVFAILSDKNRDQITKTGLAMDVFGKRAGADMAEAVRQGRFDLEKFLAVMQNGQGTIRETGRKTMDLSEHFQKFLNNVKLAIEPLAKDVFKGVSNLMKEVTAAFKQGGIEEVANLLAKKLEEAVPKILETGAQLGLKLAGALVKGFLNAPVWVQLLTGAWLLKGVALRALGEKMGTMVAGGFSGAFKGKLGSLMKVGGPAAIVSVIINEFEKMKGPTKAVKDFGNAIENTFMEVMGVSRRMAQVMIEQGNKTGKSFDQLRAGFNQTKQRLVQDIQNLSNTWGSSISEIRQRTEENMRRIAETMGRNSRAGRQAISDNFFAAVQAIKNSMKSGEISAEQGAKAIHKVLVRQLKSYGIKDVDSFLSRQQNATENATNGGASGLQRGGVLVPGSGTGDKVPAMLEPGEVVINRKAVAAMGGAQRANQINRLIPRFATGGWVDPAGPGTGVVNPAIAGVVGAWSQKYNAAINYGYDPGGGHRSPGHNVTGTATDTGPAGGWAGAALNLFESGLRFLVGKVPQILYGTAGIGTPWPDHGRGNHAHIEWGMNPNIKGMSVAGGGGLNLPRFVSDFPLGAAVAGGLNNMAAATESVIGRRLGAMGAGAPGDIGPQGSYKGPLDKVFPATSLASPGAQLTASQVQSVMDPAGLPSVFKGIAFDESGWHPGIIGYDPGGTRGLGLWQITTGFNDDIISRFGGQTQMRNPVRNALAAKAIFTRQPDAWAASGNAMARGGVVQMLKKGGTSVSIGGASGTNVNIGAAHTPAIVNRIAAAASTIGWLEEQVNLMTEMYSWASSDMGSDLGIGERADLIRNNEWLWGLYNEFWGLLGQGIGEMPGTETAASWQTLREEIGGPPYSQSKIFGVARVIDDLRNPPPTDTSSSGDESALLQATLELTKQQLAETRRMLAVSQAQLPVFNRWMGVAHTGMVLPGSPSNSYTVRAQGGEVISQPSGGPMNITVYLGDREVTDIVGVEVDGKLQKVAERATPVGGVAGRRASYTR